MLRKKIRYYALQRGNKSIVYALLVVGFPSGQRDQTVNLTRELRWFESTPHHHRIRYKTASFTNGAFLCLKFMRRGWVRTTDVVRAEVSPRTKTTLRAFPQRPEGE